MLFNTLSATDQLMVTPFVTDRIVFLKQKAPLLFEDLIIDDNTTSMMTLQSVKKYCLINIGKNYLPL